MWDKTKPNGDGRTDVGTDGRTNGRDLESLMKAPLGSSKNPREKKLIIILYNKYVMPPW